MLPPAKPILIGIDPDVDKSGVASLDRTTKKVELSTLTFFQLFDYLNMNQDKIREVRVEASWLIKKSNWHTPTASASASEKVAKNTGSNHEVGRKIIEMCQYLNIPYLEVKPLKKIWKSKDGKITHGELARIVPIPKRTNQEQRDACLLVL